VLLPYHHREIKQRAAVFGDPQRTKTPRVSCVLHLQVHAARLVKTVRTAAVDRRVTW
jgi:hypothetical protein